MPQEPSADSTLESLLDAAIACVEEFGLSGATTRRIAQRAGVNEVTLFRRFGNKAALLRAVMQREAAQVEADIAHHSGDLEEDLVRVVSAYIRLVTRRGRLLMVGISEMPRHPELQEALAGPARVVAGVLELLTRYQREGQLRPEPPAQTLMALIGPLLMSVFASGALPGTFSLPEPRAHVRAFLEGRRAAAS
ncbi:AcrR family transcriptional regulator [Deinobacterium chartae]|uniref:AcrR family transcriptional regulator n=1 Tax=Deinobacterium chartae TaxID=521158 RepID=A0A841HY55_9DEIO|nr:TetR/AcrR family transcriptional regulator [Deinobacterium chartae]MBB6096852.1 AcrR family transcriptional regulator [Deinobacterium chartae]